MTWPFGEHEKRKRTLPVEPRLSRWEEAAIRACEGIPIRELKPGRFGELMRERQAILDRERRFQVDSNGRSEDITNLVRLKDSLERQLELAQQTIAIYRDGKFQQRRERANTSFEPPADWLPRGDL